MRRSLVLHPDSRCPAALGIDAGIERLHAGRVLVRFVLRGDIARLRIPPASTPERTDGLWRHTCFELFLRGPETDAYCEINLSPSTRWAAYVFRAYREDMQPADMTEPDISVTAAGERLDLRAELTLAYLPELPAGAPWRAGLSAVIEDEKGALAYWALAHPPGRPDFHHADCLALELPPA